MRPNSVSSAGPTRAGRGGTGERTGYRRWPGSSLVRPGEGRGFQPAMVRAHARACVLSVTPGKRRRNSTAADNSPPRLNAARIAAASASVTTNMPKAWGDAPRSTMCGPLPAGPRVPHHPRDPPLERRDSVMQANRPPHQFAVCRKELPNPEPSAGTDYGFVEACSFVRGIWRTGCTSWPCCGC